MLTSPTGFSAGVRNAVLGGLLYVVPWVVLVVWAANFAMPHPAVVEVAGAYAEAERHPEQPESRAVTDWLLAAFTGGLVWIGWRQVTWMARADKTAKDNFIASRRPRLHVRSVRLIPTPSGSGDQTKIHLSLVNVGDARAEVGLIRGSLVTRKLSTDAPTEVADGKVDSWFWLEPGEIKGIDIPLNAQFELPTIRAKDRILLRGKIVYLDGRNTKRRTGFERVELGESGVYVRLKGDDFDPDTEYED